MTANANTEGLCMEYGIVGGGPNHERNRRWSQHEFPNQPLNECGLPDMSTYTPEQWEASQLSYCPICAQGPWQYLLNPDLPRLTEAVVEAYYDCPHGVVFTVERFDWLRRAYLHGRIIVAIVVWFVIGFFTGPAAAGAWLGAVAVWILLAPFVIWYTHKIRKPWRLGMIYLEGHPEYVGLWRPRTGYEPWVNGYAWLHPFTSPAKLFQNPET